MMKNQIDKKAFRDISYGMYVITCLQDKKVGCIVNTLTQVTGGDNPIISISLNKENYTNEVIRQRRKFAVSIISEEVDPNLIARFGFSSSKEKDKFENFHFIEDEQLPVLTDKMCSYFICEVENIIEMDTHDLFLAKVTKAVKLSDLKPMSYQYYHEVIKGKAPKKAPTYQEEEEKKSDSEEVWVCEVCGYIHKGPLEEGFTCPMCGVDKSHFIRKE